jgi:hypothetical protein
MVVDCWQTTQERRTSLVKLRNSVIAAAVTLVTVGTFTAASQDSRPKPQQSSSKSSQNVQSRIPLEITSEETEVSEIPFATNTVNDSNLEQGQQVVRQQGVNGSVTKVFKVTKLEGKVLSKELAKEDIKNPVGHIIAVGTKPKPRPVQAAPVAAAPQSNCDPNYTPCIPNVGYDLNCPDIRKMVRVIGVDKHGFDRDRDGFGCESYR